MNFKEYLREEERVDEVLPAFVLGTAKIAGGIGSTIGRGLVGGAKAAGGAVKQFMVDKAKKKAVKKAGEVAQNTLGREDASRMYITKAGVKFISETRKKIPKGLFDMEAHQKHMAEVKRQEELAKETKGLVRK